MTPKDRLAELRVKLDGINAQMLAHFGERMHISDEVADVKRDGNMSIFDQNREKQILEAAANAVEEGLQNDAALLMSTLMALSRRRQTMRLLGSEDILLPAPKAGEHRAAGYQGVPGAWGEQAALALYPDKELLCFVYFEDVFAAVKSGEMGWGVLPIENSQTGAIGEVYDLLRKHGCYIVGQTWVEIRHCLMAKPGTALDDVREVFSHPEGFRQCHKFLKGRAWDKTAGSNTAVAAQTVADRADNRAAAIGSRHAAARYGLSILAPDIMDSAANKTRFIAIAKDPWYDEQSDTISVTFSTAHRSGALCLVLQVFMAAGINLTRIESRPSSAGKYRFFTDLQANMADPAVRPALGQAAALCEYFEVLGCYHAG